MADTIAEYEMLEELGSGSFGVVYKALEKATGDLVAIKHIDLEGTEDDIQDIQQEIALLSACASPHITKYKTSFVRGVKLWIVMEYLGGGSCLDLLKITPFNEAQVAVICRELLLGLDYLHASGKIHRDIKAANVLLSDLGRVKIADFGVAAQLTNIKSQRMTFVGTPFWMAPEVIQEAGYDFKADVWSLGITTIELVKGAPPNADLHPMKALFHIPKSPAPRLEGNQFSRELRSFVACCLIKDPERRPGARDLLQHRFIQRAGKVDTLRDVVLMRHQERDLGNSSTQLKYYEETLRDLPREKHEDDWVFDTVRPLGTMAQSQTTKKRKLSQNIALPSEPPTEMLMDLDLNKDNEAASNNAPSVEPTSDPAPQDTVMKISKRRSSVATTRKVSSLAGKTPLHNGRVTSSPRRQSGQKQPLALDMNFGNSNSNTRQFRRVSDESPHSLEPDKVTNENVPLAAEATTKEGKIGRRIFAKAIDPAIQEVYAQTAVMNKQETISKLGQACAALDALDPEGEFLLFKSILDRIQGDSKLSQLLLPNMATPNASEPSTPQKQKLILAQNNPHLKSHRRRQSSQASVMSAVSEKPAGLPGEIRPGMEHTKQLADALYSKWLDGLKARWPQG